MHDQAGHPPGEPGRERLHQRPARGIQQIRRPVEVNHRQRPVLGHKPQQMLQMIGVVRVHLGGHTHLTEPEIRQPQQVGREVGVRPTDLRCRHRRPAAETTPAHPALPATPPSSFTKPTRPPRQPTDQVRTPCHARRARCHDHLNHHVPSSPCRPIRDPRVHHNPNPAPSGARRADWPCPPPQIRGDRLPLTVLPGLPFGFG
jgi:hypothetical protein